jgi:hypothetical protein
MDLENLAMYDPQKSQDAVEIMADLYTADPSNNMHVEPDATCYTICIDGWIRAGKLKEAQALLYRMEYLADTTNYTKVAPSELTYTTMLEGWTDNARRFESSCDAVEKAEALLHHMYTRQLVPDVKLWALVLNGWCKRSGVFPHAMEKAEKILDQMEAIGGCAAPDILAYTAYTGALSRSKWSNLATKAEGVLDRMTKHGIIADDIVYSSILNCWAKAVSRQEREKAATQALKIIDDMERMYAEQQYHIKPTLITYATAIRAIGYSLDRNAPQLAEGVLSRMYRLCNEGTIANLKPTTLIYNAYLNALSRTPKQNRLRYARRAEQLLQEMTERSELGEKDVTPDVRSWAAVLRAWAQSGHPDAAENAQRVLDELENLYASGKTSVRPNYVCYTTVMCAWRDSRKADAMDRMEGILKLMERSYEDTLVADVRPNTVSYVTAIDAFVRRNEKDAAIRAQRTVNRMAELYAKGLGHVRPTRPILNTLIHAWSKSDYPDAPQRAEKIFKWMESQYKEKGDSLLKPDEVTLCAVLNTWANHAKTGGAERTQLIWDHIRAVPEEERGFPVTIAIPNIVIKSIARSEDHNAPRRAEDILIFLETEYTSGQSALRPDVTTYSSVINACAYYKGNATGRSEALQIAMRTFDKVSTSAGEKPNCITYGTLFKVIANMMLHGNEREELVRTLFDRCCSEGNVDGFVLAQLRHASAELYRSLVKKSGNGVKSTLTVKHIPREWCANVVDHPFYT